MKAKNNPGAERAILSGLVQYGKDALYDVADLITINSFGLEANQALYKCIEKVLENTDKVDATSIIAAADSLNLASILTKNKTDIEYIRSLFNFPIQLQNVRVMAKQVAKLEFVRKAQSSLLEAYHSLEEFDGNESIDEIVAVPENAVFSLSNEINSRSDSNPSKLGETAEERLKFLMENPVETKGIPTPWPIFNQIVGDGIREGVTLIASRPGVGKSATSMNVGWHVADNLNIPVLYIDTELVQEEQENRLIAYVSGVHYRLIETGKCGLDNTLKQKVLNTPKLIKNKRFYHKWVGGKPFEEIVSIIRRWIMKEVGFDENGNTKPHLVIYDYFKLMDENALNKMQEYQAIGFQISHLSDFCKQYQTPCLAFVQVNRDGITKDTSDIISQSDRLLWLCVACCVLKEKQQEEVFEDGAQYGNRKMFPIKSRYAAPMNFGDYICMNLDGETFRITEITTKFKIHKAIQQKTEGFESEEKSENVDLNELQ